MERLRLIWAPLNGSLWFVPTVLVCLGVLLALGLVEAQVLVQSDLSEAFPRLFGAGAEGARGMLTAIATSMATVAGVVFSVTIVALSLTASQYSPRVLRNFMSDRPTQVVLGTFVSVFAYCLIVLRTIRGEPEGLFVPSLAVLGGVLMALVGVALLIYFIHHVATAIQLPYILDRISRETGESIERLFPSQLGDELQAELQARCDPRNPLLQMDSGSPCILATKDAYLISLDGDTLMDQACQLRRLVKVSPRVGDFVSRGDLLLQVAGPEPLDEPARRALSLCFGWQNERTAHQDVPYGMQQLVDVALKALSASTHDPTTAALCVDRLGALLKRVSSRHMAGPCREKNGQLRVWVRGASHGELVDTALASITHHAASHVQVHDRLLAAVESAASATADPARRSTLARQVDAHLARLADCDLPPRERERLVARGHALLAWLTPPSAAGGVDPAG